MQKAIILTHEEVTELLDKSFPRGFMWDRTDLDSKPYLLRGVSEEDSLLFISGYGNRYRDTIHRDGLYLSDSTMVAFLNQNMDLPKRTRVVATDYAYDGLAVILYDTGSMTGELNFMQAVDACFGGAFVIGSDFACGTYLFEHDGVVTVNPGKGYEFFPFMVTASTVKQTYTAYQALTALPQEVQDALLH